MEIAKSGLVCGVWLVLSTASAFAADEIFTFTSTSEPGTTIEGTFRGTAGVAGAVSGTSQGKFVESGEELANTFDCVAMSQPPGGTFMSNVVCEVTGLTGAYQVFAGCNVVGEEEQSCVGGLVGVSGEYEGRRGSITWHAQGNASKGTGIWH